MRVLLGFVTALGLVVLPFVAERGSRATLFGWLVFALLVSVARYFGERARVQRLGEARATASWPATFTR